MLNKASAKTRVKSRKKRRSFTFKIIVKIYIRFAYIYFIVGVFRIPKAKVKVSSKI